MLNDKMECESRRAQALVLVVDDDPTMRLLIGESLQQAGFAIEEAEDGLPALTAFERLQPDIVLLDVNMPGMDGFTVCTELRRMPVGNGIPVLMVTGLDDEASINRAYEAGATDFITKPINWAILGHRVRYILRASQAFDDLRRTEAKIRQRTAELQKVTELLSTKSCVQSILLTSTDDAMFADVLDVVLDVFQSRFGFFGYIDEAGSLVCASMSRDILEGYEVADKSLVFPREQWGGLWGRILLEKKGLYKNEFHCVPKGHLPLFRSLGSPIVYQGEMIGSIHVANSEGDYGEEDHELMESICSIIAPVLNARLQRDREERERKRAEQLLAAQHTVTRVLAEAPTFADAGPRILQAIGESLGWDLGGLWRMDRQANVLRCVELWHTPSIEEAREFEGMARSLTFSPGVGLVGHVWTSGKPVWISDVVEDINSPYALTVASAGLHSAFAFPILLGDEILGVIDFFSREIRNPDNDMLQMLVVVGSQIGQFSERRRAEQALRESEEQFRQLAENIPQVFWITNAAQNQPIYISTAYEKIWGRTLESLVGNPDGWMESIHPDDYKRVFAALKNAPLGEYLEEYRIVRPDGTVRWVQDRAFPVANEQGQVYRIAGIVEDITDRKEAEQRLLHLAHYDSLTNLPNRVLFRDRLIHAIARANRNKQIVALIFIDLDRFKEINDTLGHDTGDCLLIGVATRLKNTLRQADTLARLGGDEFTLIVEDFYHETECENTVITIAQKILESFSSPFRVEGRELFVTPSIGITLYPFDADDVDSLLKCADVAMYHAKALGRNNYQFYTAEINAMAPEKLKVEHNLRRSLEREEFRLHYQPKVDLTTGEICGVEALLHWQRPDHGLVSPAEFIPLLEETGLILPVGEWVLRAALTQIRTWQMAGVTPVPVAINLSARQFQQKDLERMIRRALDEFKIDPILLELEITESSLMKNEKQAITTLLDLKSLGIHLSIDDFGTGYSSLSHLKRFPVDTLKIDRSFIKDITTDTDDALITCTIITMAHNLKLKAVAEGVESEG